MKKISIITVAIMMMLGTMVMAATEQDVFFDFEIPYIFDLQWGVENGAYIDLTGVNAITPVEIANGMKAMIPGGHLRSTANANYKISVVAGGDFFEGGNGVKPISNLMVSMNGAEFLPVDSDPVELLISLPTIDKINTVDYNLQLSPDDAVGIYSTVLTYTIAATP